MRDACLESPLFVLERRLDTFTITLSAAGHILGQCVRFRVVIRRGGGGGADLACIGAGTTSSEKTGHF